MTPLFLVFCTMQESRDEQSTLKMGEHNRLPE